MSERRGIRGIEGANPLPQLCRLCMLHSQFDNPKSAAEQLDLRFLLMRATWPPPIKTFVVTLHTSQTDRLGSTLAYLLSKPGSHLNLLLPGFFQDSGTKRLPPLKPCKRQPAALPSLPVQSQPSQADRPPPSSQPQIPPCLRPTPPNPLPP